MNILMLIPDFGRGGAERVFSHLGGELAKKHRVVDCVFNRQIEREYVSGNETVDLNVPGGRNLLSKVLYFVIRVYRLRRIKKQYAIDLTISHLEGADYVNVLSRYKDRVILCIHGTKVYDKNIKGFLGWLRLKILIPFLYKKAAHLVAVSHGIRHELVNFFGLPLENITVINNFFDISAIKTSAAEPLQPDYEAFMRDNDVIITSGRLTHEKNHKLLIQLMPVLLKQNPFVKLVILGSGGLRDLLISEARKTGLRVQADDQPFHSDNHIFFLGFLKNPFAYFRRSKIFLLPSLWEGFPLVLCEALICETAVVAHDCATGPREIVAPHLNLAAVLNDVTYSEYGILVPFSADNDQEAIDKWTRAILSVFKNEILRDQLITNASKRVSAFSKAALVQQWFDLIDKQMNVLVPVDAK